MLGRRVCDAGDSLKIDAELKPQTYASEDAQGKSIGGNNFHLKMKEI